MDNKKRENDNSAGSSTKSKKFKENSPRELSRDDLVALIIKCSNFAAIKHKNQRRSDKAMTPYINHPIGVANILTEEGDVSDPVVIISALLHDTVEDTFTTLEEIEKEFGPEVKHVVSEVTDDKMLPKMVRKQLQIEHSPYISHEAKLVKLADKIYNLRDINRCTPEGWSSERCHAYFEWAKKVIKGCRGTNAKLEAILDEIFEKEKV